MAITIDRKLNFVVPIEREEGDLFVHSQPLGREAFRRYYAVMGQAFTKIFADGLGLLAGPRLAAFVLEDAAKAANQWDGPDGVEKGLLGEIRRLTNAIVPGEKGWEAMALDDAKGAGLISPEEAEDAEGAIVFFILCSALQKRTQILPMLKAAGEFWGTQVTSSNCTEFAASLRTSTEAVSSGEKTPALSVPS